MCACVRPIDWKKKNATSRPRIRERRDRVKIGRTTAVEHIKTRARFNFKASYIYNNCYCYHARVIIIFENENKYARPLYARITTHIIYKSVIVRLKYIDIKINKIKWFENVHAIFFFFRLTFSPLKQFATVVTRVGFHFLLIFMHI